jgi:hypothetical protein
VDQFHGRQAVEQRLSFRAVIPVAGDDTRLIFDLQANDGAFLAVNIFQVSTQGRKSFLIGLQVSATVRG